MAGPLRAALGVAARLYGLGWEARRRCYALGWLAPRSVAARVVSVGNLTVGGTGKTTLALHLAQRAAAAGRRVAVVCRNYRPGRHGLGDEAILYRGVLGAERVFAGPSKLREAEHAVAAGRDLLLVDDGFSTWPLARDLDVVLIDARDPWGGGRLLPHGRLREPRRALQRADVVVVSRLGVGEPPEPLLDSVRPYAPGARLAAGRHRVTGVRLLGGGETRAGGRVRVVSGTGHPAAIAASASEAGLEVVGTSFYRDHHWYTPGEARRETEAAARDRAALLLTAKDAIRWPVPGDERTWVLEVGWEWVLGGDRVLDLVLDGREQVARDAGPEIGGRGR